MEGKDLIEYTLETALALAEESRPPTLALQAYLDRAPSDVSTALSSGIKVRLVKGAYLGDTNDFGEVQRRFRSLCETIIVQGHPFSIGTHDPEILDWVMRKVGSRRLLVEFGFLKGLGDETKVLLAQKGWAVSEYVPYGADAKAYEARRLRYLNDLDRLGRRPIP
jgi:proline dehydrogenase